MRHALRFVFRFGGIALFLLLGPACLLADDKKPMEPANAKPAVQGELQFQAYLVWGTTNSISPNDKHKPVSDEIQKRLADLPLKWTHYFLCNELPVALAKGGTTQVKMSDKLSIRIKDLDAKKTEVVVIDKKGDEVLKRTQPLPKGDFFVLAGNAPNGTGWFVVLKRIK